jgi:GT2 family glycosyltransferase
MDSVHFLPNDSPPQYSPRLAQATRQLTAHSMREVLKQGDPSPAGTLRVSIVCYASNRQHLSRTIATLRAACSRLLENTRLHHVEILLVDNGPDADERSKIEGIIREAGQHLDPHIQFSLIGDSANVGFGRGHNLTLKPPATEFHLILNPDVELAPDALVNAVAFMDHNLDCGLIAPAVRDEAGGRLFLCKRYPSVFGLLLRGFAPGWLRRRFHTRLARYEMRDVIGEAVYWSPPIISGCFILSRASVLGRLRGFDPRYFLYFEDFDLSLRAAGISRIAYVPAVRILHHGGHAARKGWRHIWLFVRSAVIFFNSHGWKWF